MTAVAPAGDPFPNGMITLQSHSVVSNAVPNYPELVEAPEFGEHDACEGCPHALSCLSGALEYLAVAKSREEQREGKSLPCVDDGLVRLKVITEEETGEQWVDDGTITIEPASPGTIITTDTITVGTTTVPNSNALDYSFNPGVTGKSLLNLSTTTLMLGGEDP